MVFELAGKIKCPGCSHWYTPRHSTKHEAMATSDKVAREQWLSGICSDVCWNDLFAEQEQVELELTQNADHGRS